MKACDKQYNKTVRNPANFSFDKRSYYTGWRAALEMVEDLYAKYNMEDWDIVACNIKRDIEQELNDED